jgi:crotonobetainyl-CoA:carnitine CoA-transferase CaiB-like acyl-CoA transferase
VVDTLASGRAPERIGNRAYSGSPGGGQFRCRDGLLAVAANTRSQLLRLADALGLRAEVEPLVPGGERAFAGGEHRERIVSLLSERFAEDDVRTWETRLNRLGVPAAAMRDLAESVRDAEAAGSLRPWTLPADPPVRTPGLGFRARHLFGRAGEPFGAGQREPARGD